MERLAVGYKIEEIDDGWKLKTLEDVKRRKIPSRVCTGGDDLDWIEFTKTKYPGLTLDDTQESTCEGEDNYYILDWDPPDQDQTPRQDYKQTGG